jgi:hypothetical protein
MREMQNVNTYSQNQNSITIKSKSEKFFLGSLKSTLQLIVTFSFQKCFPENR